MGSVHVFIISALACRKHVMCWAGLGRVGLLAWVRKPHQCYCIPSCQHFKRKGSVSDGQPLRGYMLPDSQPITFVPVPQNHSCTRSLEIPCACRALNLD